MRDTLVYDDDYVDSWDNYDQSYTEDGYMDWLGLDFQGLLVMLSLVALVLLMLSVLWNYCAKDEETVPESLAAASAQPIVVQEIRPGLILMKGYPSQEETLRIVAEYDALRGGPSHATYSHMPSHPTHYGTYGAGPQSYVQPPNTHVEGYAVNGSLIDLIDETPRPPPYAPAGQDPHGPRMVQPQPH